MDTEGDWTFVEEGFLCHILRSFELEPPRTVCGSGRLSRSWRRSIEEEVERVEKLEEIPVALLCGDPMLWNGVTGN